MTTVPAANNAMLSVALAARRAAVHLRAAHREVVAQEVARRGATARVAEAILRENRTVAVVAPAATKTTIIHRDAVEEAGGGKGHKTDKTFKKYD